MLDGGHVATIEIASDDPDENPFDFQVSGVNRAAQFASLQRTIGRLKKKVRKIKKRFRKASRAKKSRLRKKVRKLKKKQRRLSAIQRSL